MSALLNRWLALALAGAAMAARAADATSPDAELTATIGALDAAAFDAFNHREAPASWTGTRASSNPTSNTLNDEPAIKPA